MNRKKISFVIPCYRSEKTIAGVVDEVRCTMRSHDEFDYEIVLVSDASPDNVFRVICDLAKTDSRIRGVEFTRNFGQHSARMAGYRMAEGDYIVSVDDDGQTPVDKTFALIERLEMGYDAAYASYENSANGFFRKLGSKMNQLMSELLIEKPKELQTNSFLAMNRIVRDEIIRYDAPFPYISGLVLRTTRKCCNVPMTYRKRQQGKSGYTFTKLLALWMNGFTAFSIKPLRCASVAGFLCAALGLLYGCFTIVRKIMNPAILAGYSSMMAVFLFVGGVIMLMLGIIGEYIGRIYICLNKAPQYVIRTTTDGQTCMEEALKKTLDR